MTAYILTADAESDLRSVIRYTHAQWGTAQVRRYISALERGIANLAGGKVLSRI
ncbi:type II toxin-antitoxin system RelE/ParE family toxin [Rhizobium multihospitium]|uniref:type II toxin-antitoxin system RelE/ParE family toxin n=1 Tax=Rhizobium multihospitium TaxID=410764 RepID=UPI003CCA6528